MYKIRRTTTTTLAALAAAFLVACQPLTDTAPPLTAPGRPALAIVPSQGAAADLDVASWNIEWFGSTANGPTDEALQLANARDVIAGTNADVWGVAEIVDQAAWNNLESQLTGYTGFLASESNVTGGSASYSATEQKVGFLYKSSLGSIVGARIILTANDFDFAGRPPLEVTLRTTLNGVTEDLVFIVLHMKAFADDPSWQRRLNASTALKSYLDTTYPTKKVFVIGDFNDDVDTSITPGQASPYANFVNDPARYRFPTKALTDAGVSSTTTYPDMVDHHLATNEAASTEIANSVEVYRVDSYITSYDATTSDHFPVLSHYTFGGAVAPTVTVQTPNGGESWAMGSAQSITWSSAGITTLALDYTLDAGVTWTAITASTSAVTGTYSWTVPSTASTSARVRARDVNSTALDASDASFTISSAVPATPAQVILNEILANEPGSSTAGEFVEIVNIGGTAINIGGWTVSDATATRHTFAAGTSLNPGKAIVVFGDASGIPAGTPSAIGSSTGALSLANGGDSVILRNGSTTVASYTYAASLAGKDGVSMNRNPEASATGAFVLHTTLSSLKASPGKRVTGVVW